MEEWMDVASAAPQAYDTDVPKIYKLAGGYDHEYVQKHLGTILRV